MSNERPLVVGIGGSIRNRPWFRAVDGVDERVSSEDLLEHIEDLEHRDIYHDDFLGAIQPILQELAGGRRKLITNSETMLLTALYGAKRVAEVEYHKLTDYIGFGKSHTNPYIDYDRMEPLDEAVGRADGVVLGSPTYFGDRSSLMHLFIKFASERNLLENTVVGAVSCGSKRNGGQETTNVYALFENLDHGAIVVGNGPKTCQYGGTGWGGDIGDVAQDEFGLETSLGTGLRVSQVASLVQSARAMRPGAVLTAAPGEESFRVGVIVTRDRDGELRETIEGHVDAIELEGVEFDVVDFTDRYIQACIGCDVCPTPSKVEELSGEGKDYKCIIDEKVDDERFHDDDLQHLHGRLVDNDALIIAAIDVTDETGVDDVYQALLERTRYIRRDDFLLHNVPLAALVLEDPEAAGTYPMKIMTSWMRHNTIVNPPIRQLTVGDVPLDDDAVEDLEAHYRESARESLESFVDRARRLRAASVQSGPDALSYKATGYQQKVLDQTVAERH